MEHILQLPPEKRYMGSILWRTCVSEKVFILPLYLIDNFIRLLNVSWTFSFLTILKSLISSSFQFWFWEIWSLLILDHWYEIHIFFLKLFNLFIPSVEKFHENALWCESVFFHCIVYLVVFQSGNSCHSFLRIFLNYLLDFLLFNSFCSLFLWLLFLRWWSSWTGSYFWSLCFLFLISVLFVLFSGRLILSFKFLWHLQFLLSFLTFPEIFLAS